MIVPNRLTPLQAADAGRALFAAYAQVTGAQPSDSVGALLLAQSALETGNWQKIHNFNFGNLKARADYPLITQFRCSEVIDGVEQFFDPPSPQCNFRAYSVPTEGALDYVRILRSRPHWWAGLQSGDPSAFVDALATPPKYFTANLETYKRTLNALYRQFLPLVPHLRPGPPPPPAQTQVVQPPTSPQVAISASGSSSSPQGSASTSPPIDNAAELSDEPPESVDVEIVEEPPVAAASTAKPAEQQRAVAAGSAIETITLVAEAVREAAEEARTATSQQRELPPLPPRRVPPRPPPLPPAEVAPAEASAPETPHSPAQGAIDVVVDTANAIAVVADAAEALVAVSGAGGVPALPQSGPIGKAALAVRIVRWVAQMLAWIGAALRSALTKRGGKLP